MPLSLSSNIIVDNLGDGILLTNHSNNNVIQNNSIGVNAASAPLGNKEAGVAIDYSSSNNEVGGTLTQNGNIIADNKSGVVIGANKCDLSVGNSILSNSIFDNTCLGIDLANDGVIENHKKEPDGGPK